MKDRVVLGALLLLWGCASSVDSSGGGGSGGGAAGSGGKAGGGGKGGSGGGGSAGGGGTQPDGGGSEDVAIVQPGRLVISEVMYHPVGEDTDVDNHEFIEIYNRGDAAIQLAKWRLDGQVKFEFPAGSSIDAHQYVVVAKNKTMLAAVTNYQLGAANVLGNYTGELDNGGGRIAILDPGGELVDTVTYNDGFPWPIFANALGVGEDWLTGSPLLPVAKHQYMGVSLERISFDIPANEVSNWAPSPVDGATPGHANKAAGTPLPVVEQLSALPEGQADPLIRSTNKVVVQAVFSSRGTVTSPQVEYFVNVPQRPGAAEPKVLAPLTESSGSYTVVLPVQADNSIVRYRIVGDRGAGKETISPRPTDPYAWHAYFVNPTLATTAPTYHIFISSANWGQMWKNMRSGNSSGAQEEYGPVFTVKDPKFYWPNGGCVVNPGWEAVLPATFVHQGKVYDVRVKYQGGRWNRAKGSRISTWTFPGPTGGPSPLLVLSWNIHFPRYQKFESLGSIILNKLRQACPGVDALVETRLMASEKIPVQTLSFARLYINGGYYSYMMRVESMNEDMVQRVEGKGKPIGDLFKANSSGIDEGPLFDSANGSPVKLRVKGIPYDNICPAITLEQKWRATYPRKAPDWKGENVDELKEMILALATARAAGTAATRAYLDQNWDVPFMLTQYAMRNWAGAWDDIGHNYFPYKRPDGKWVVWPQDLDQDFGAGLKPPFTPSAGADNVDQVLPTSTFYEGEDGAEGKLTWNPPPPPPSPPDPNAPKSPPGLNFSHLKDAFQKTYRTEFNARLVELSKTTLNPDNVNKVVDQAAMEFSLADWNAAPSEKACNPTARIAQIRKWATDRHAYLMAQPWAK